MLLTLLLIGGIIGFFVILSKISPLLERLEKLEREAAKNSELKLMAHRIAALESQFRRLKEPFDTSKAEVSPESIEAASAMEEVHIAVGVPPLPHVAEPVHEPPPEVVPSPLKPPVLHAELPRQAEPPPRVSVVKPPRPSRTREEWEALIGGKWLNRIGALALIMGIGFFLKYAFDRNWIMEWMRVLMGGVVGVALLIGGRRFYKKGLEIFSQGLLGAGVSILYLSVYASFNFYHLIPQAIAFILMSAVTFVTFSQAFKYDSLAVSLLGWAGGFLTPFLLSTGTANEVGLFSYVVLLDVGLLAVVLRKDLWVILEPLTFGATYLTYLLWHLKFFRPVDLLPTVLFLTLFWGLFYAVDVYRMWRANHASPQMRQGIAVLNAVFYYTAMYTVINPDHHDWMGLVTLVIGAIYFFTILIAKKRQTGDALVVVRYILTAIVLLVLATTIQFSGFTTVIYWSLEALIILGCGARWKVTYVWSAALGLFVLAVVKFFMTAGAFSYFPLQQFTLLFNRRTFALSVLTATLGMSTLFLRPLSGLPIQRTRSSLHYAWCILLFVLCTVEVNDAFRGWLAGGGPSMRQSLEFRRDMILAGIWMVYSLPLAWFGLRRDTRPILLCGLGALIPSIFLAALRGIAFDPIRDFRILLNLRATIFLLLIAGLMVHATWVNRRETQAAWKDSLAAALEYAWGVLILLLASVETYDYFRWLEIEGGPVTAMRLPFGRDMILAVIWMVYSLPMVWIGFRRKSLPMVTCGLGAVVLSLLLGGVRGISFQPIRHFSLLFNLRALALIFVMVGLWTHLRWLRSQQRSYGWAKGMISVLQYFGCMLLFLLCTVETVDHFRWLETRTGRAGIPYLHFMRDMILPAPWIFYSLALIWFGLRRNILAMLHCGLGALALAIVWGGVRGISFVPLERFTLLLNVRAFVLVILTLACFVDAFWLKQRRLVFQWATRALMVLQIVAIVLIFELVTFEIWDFFGRALKESTSGSPIFNELIRLKNLRHLSLSGSWLLYSIILLILGFWRRIYRFRIIAIFLLGVSILKIFIYDLSFLETLYRIFSFIGLGLILLIASYLYQRYKAVIFGETSG